MTKTYCNRCKQEITDRNFSCEIDTKEMGSVLMPVKGMKNQAVQRIEQGKYHLCKSCWEEVKKQLNNIL